MASAYPESEYESTDLFECKICLEDMVGRQPRTLHCNHTFCHKCLKKLVSKKFPFPAGQADVEQLATTKKIISCPTCRIETSVPSGNIKKLPVNHDLAKMKEHFSNELKRQDDLKTMEMLKPLCDILSNHKSRPNATKMCTECVRKLCDDCAEHHAKMGSTKDHTVAPLKYKQRDETSTKVCEIHDQPIEHICTECSQYLCLECTCDDKHSSHLEQIAAFPEGIRILRDNAKALTKICDRFGTQAKSFLDNVNAEKEKLDKANEELTNLRTILEGKLVSVNKILKVVHNSKEMIQSGIYNISTSKKKLQSMSNGLEILSALEDDDFVGEFNKWKLQSWGILNYYDTERWREYGSLKFQKGTIDLSGTVGELQNPWLAMPYCPVLKFVLDGKENVTLTEPVQIVATDKEDAILVDHGKSIHHLDNKGVGIKCLQFEVYSVAVIDKEVLLVPDKINENIYSVTLDRNSRLEPKGKLKGEYMFVEGHEIIACFYKKNLVSTFNLEREKQEMFTANVNNARCLSKLVADNKLYIVITKKTTIAGVTNDSDMDAINENDEALIEEEIDNEIVADTSPGIHENLVTSNVEDQDAGDNIFVFCYDGTLKSSFGKTGTQDGQLLNPRATAATPGGHILVTDCGNHRISKFSIDGVFLEHVFTERDGIKYPFGLDYKAPNLWITEYDGNEHCRVKLYDILID